MRSDKDGFIQGDPIADMRRSGEGRSEALLYGISGDVQAIRRALTGAATPSSRRSPRGDTASVLAPAAVPTSARKGERAQAATSASQSGTARLAVLADAVSAKPSQRNKKGQFSSSKGDSDASRAGPGGQGSAGSESMFKGLGDRIAGAINNSGSMDEADPAVKAFGEVAQPLARGYQALAGGDKAERQKTGWFRKIFGELRMFRAEETGFSKAAGKSLKALEEKPEAGAAAGGGGVLGTVMNGIKAALPGIATVLGGLAAAMAPLLAMLKVTEWAADTTHDKERVEGIKEGAAAAAKEALKTVGIDKDAEIAKARADTLEKRDGEYAKEAAAKAAFKAPPGVKEGTTEYNDAFYRDQQAKEAAAAEQAKKSPLRRGWEAAKGWALGQTSKIFESGKGGAGTVSTGKGDHGGASYGTYQLSSSQGTLNSFLKDSKYGAQFAGLKPGSPEFNAKWKDVAKNDPSFGDQQHDFIKRTHYDKAMQSLAKGGVDLSGKGAAVQDAVWSSSVQFGPGGGSSLIKKALKGADVASMSDADIVSAVQDYKLKNNDTLFKSSDAKNRAGTASRATAEKARLVALATSAQAPVMASAPPAASVRAPSIPAVAEAPVLTVPLSSSTKSQAVSVSQAPADVGQDVRDRRIAHIATGGVSN